MRKLLKTAESMIQWWRQKQLHSPSQTRCLVFLHDILMILPAWGLSYWLRFNLGRIPHEILQQALQTLPVVLVIQALFYWVFGLYRGVWRFSSLPDIARILKTVGAAVVMMVLVLFLSAQLIPIPRSIFPLYGLLLCVFLSGSRLLYRYLKEYVEHKSNNQLQKVLIVGAGQSGENIVRDLMRHPKNNYHVLGFLDDDVRKKGQEIHGIRVVGKPSDIPRLVLQEPVDLIIIAVPSARSADMRRIVGYCEQSDIPFRTLPSIQDLTDGKVQVESLRAVSLEDLLGRDPVSLDWGMIRKSIEGNCILVSGGGGSIGRELCRQIMKLAPRKLIIVEHSESNLYELDREIRRTAPANLDIEQYLLDVTDRFGVRHVFQNNTVDLVFHAAAYKHVPLLQHQIRTAVKNNVLGTQILAEEAAAAKVKKFILISTDKAVNPTSLMGATKRVAEIFCQNYGQQVDTHFITVRFGNVLGSTGSVVPLFKQQIEAGGPVTVTDPEMTRFFMTIPEAAQLIMQSAVMGKGKEIFVLDMGEPVKIQYLAEQMILLAGKVPGRDIEIKHTGLRPGEKRFEELFHQAEPLMETSHERILQAKCRQRDWEVLITLLTEMQRACEQWDEAGLQKNLLVLVPEYHKG